VSHPDELVRRDDVQALDLDASSAAFTPPARSEDAALVTRARAGERLALERLYRRHAPDVTRTVTFLLGPIADVDDVVQDAFIKAFASLGALRDPGSFGAWTGRIAANLARSRLRRRGLFKRLGLDRGEAEVRLDELARHDLDPEQRADLARISRVLATRPTDERVAWTLRRVEGWPLADVAASLGLSLATVKRRIGAADAALAALVGEGER